MSELGKVIEELERFERDTRDFRGQPMSLLMPDQVEALTEYGKATFAHAPTLIAAAKRAEQAERERDEEAAAHSRTVDERESAVDAITRAYAIVVGESPTWSNRFGYAEALGDIENAFHALQRAARQSASADSLKAENRSLVRTCEMMLKRNDLLEEEVVNRSRNHADVVKTYHEKLKSTEARRTSLLAAVDRIREQLEDSQAADENEGDYGERIELLMGIVKEVL